MKVLLSRRMLQEETSSSCRAAVWDTAVRSYVAWSREPEELERAVWQAAAAAAAQWASLSAFLCAGS